MQSVGKIEYHKKVINFDSIRLTESGETMSIMMKNVDGDTFSVYIGLDHHFEDFIFEFEYYQNEHEMRNRIRDPVYMYYDYKNIIFNARRFERALRCFSKLDHRDMLLPINVKSARSVAC